MPRDTEVLVRVHAATVNRTDCAIIRAKPFVMRFITGLLKPKNPILGTEFAGEIVATGKEVTSFEVGDRVFGFHDEGVAAYGEYLCIEQDDALAIIPENSSYEQAAPGSEGAHYAVNFINKVTIEAGQKVLVNGATGGIGSAAVQLLKYHGAEVTAVCSGDHKELVESLGACRVIDYLTEDFTQDHERYSFVFDTAGKSTFGQCKGLLEPGGVYISSELGPWIQNIFLALLTPLFGGRKVIFPFPANRKGSVLLIQQLIEEGKFRAVIDQTFSLDDISEAYRYVEKGQKIGNVVITMNGVLPAP
ncbi:MAG: NAD(P)-dependent alcohol dehydrogenase [Candidatus Hydrogenedentota bacterium]